ncbi:MAG: hypothetical protein WC756_14470 [Taibaiella sp.]|jgi:hypothetical protein
MKIVINRLLAPLGLESNQSSGLLDFAIGVILIIVPWFYVQDANIRSLAIVMTIGSALILYSIFTDYRYGIFKFIAQKIHDALDLTISITLMALSPLR